MNHVAVNSHHTETGGDRDGFVCHHPDTAGKSVHLHRKRHRRIDGAVAGIFQCTGDPVRGLVHDLSAAVELLIGDAARRRPDVVAVHLHDQGYVAQRAGQCDVDVLPLGGQLRALDAGERDIVGTRVQTHLAQPVGVDNAGLRRFP